MFDVTVLFVYTFKYIFLIFLLLNIKLINNSNNERKMVLENDDCYLMFLIRRKCGELSYVVGKA